MLNWRLAAATLVTLSGCAPFLEVRLASTSERLPSPSFSISDPQNREEAPRYDTVEVLDQSGETIWKMRAVSFGGAPRPAQVTYGIVPSEFEQVTPAAPLREDGHYSIYFSASGPKDGRFHFRVDAGGTVLLDPRR